VKNREGGGIMRECDFCGKTIVFGGVREFDLSFCSKQCLQKGYHLVNARKAIPKDVLLREAQKVHQGLCPKCNGNGPIDVHTSHRIYSLILFSSWKSIPSISCRSCGIKSQIKNCIFSLMFGWWGFPWGLLITPVQITKNILGIVRGLDETSPSDNLKNLIRNIIGQKLLESQNQVFVSNDTVEIKI
jgi:hypothetical protein